MVCGGDGDCPLCLCSPSLSRAPFCPGLPRSAPVCPRLSPSVPVCPLPPSPHHHPLHRPPSPRTSSPPAIGHTAWMSSPGSLASCGCCCATSRPAWRATFQHRDPTAAPFRLPFCRQIPCPGCGCPSQGLADLLPPRPHRHSPPKKGRTGIRTQISAIFQAVCSPGRPIIIGLSPYPGSESNLGPSP